MNIRFSDGNIEYRFTEKNFFFSSLQFCFLCPICNIYSFDISVLCINAVSFGEIIVLGL